MKRAGHVLLALALFLLADTVGLIIASIWTVGPNSDRLGSTAFTLGCLSLLCGFLGGIILSES